jgi:hypothetical protein
MLLPKTKAKMATLYCLFLSEGKNHTSSLSYFSECHVQFITYIIQKFPEGFFFLPIYTISGYACTRAPVKRLFLLMLVCRDCIGDSALAGDLRWAGTYGVNIDFVARSHCSVEFISIEAMKVCYH